MCEYIQPSHLQRYRCLNGHTFLLRTHTLSTVTLLQSLMFLAPAMEAFALLLPSFLERLQKGKLQALMVTGLRHRRPVPASCLLTWTWPRGRCHTVEDLLSGSCAPKAWSLGPQRLSTKSLHISDDESSGEDHLSPPPSAGETFSGPSVVCLPAPFGGNLGLQIVLGYFNWYLYFTFLIAQFSCCTLAHVICAFVSSLKVTVIATDCWCNKFPWLG